MGQASDPSAAVCITHLLYLLIGLQLQLTAGLSSTALPQIIAVQGRTQSHESMGSPLKKIVKINHLDTFRLCVVGVGQAKSTDE